jgi:hypothetical protein
MKKIIFVIFILCAIIGSEVAAQDSFKRFEFNGGYGAYFDLLFASEGYGFKPSNDIGTNVWCALNYNFSKKWGIEGGYMRFTDPRREKVYFQDIPNQVIIDINFRQYLYTHFPYLTLARSFEKNKNKFKVGLGLNLEHSISQGYDVVNDIKYFPNEVPRVIVRESGRDSRNIEMGALLNLDYQYSPNPYYHLGVKLVTSYTFTVSFYQYLTISPYIGIKF